MMKKYLVFIMIIMIILIAIGANFCQAATITLAQIVNQFNSSKEIQDSGMQLVASANNDTLTITAPNSVTLQYKLNGNILSANFSSDNAFAGAVVSLYVADSVGQLHGYSDGEMLSTLSSDQIMNYTLEKEGIQISQGASGEFIFKLDITKKIPLLNFDDAYIEVSDLEGLKEFLVGGGSAQTGKGNVVFHKRGYDNELTVIVGEKSSLTKNTFRSIQSILEVMFETPKASSYFKANYPNSSFSNKEFTGFKIEVNPTKDSMEEAVLGKDDKYKFVRITIDKAKAKTAIENFKEQSGSEESKNIVQTDKNTNIKLEASTNVIPETTKLVVNKITSGSTYSTALKILEAKTEKFVLYDITLMNENVTIQPNGKVKISLPIPQGYDKARISVYRVSETGEKVKYSTKISGNYVVFETDHFSNYAVAQEKVDKEGNVVINYEKGDNTVATNKIPQTGEQTSMVISIIFAVAVVTIIAGYKIRKYKDIN